MLENVVKTLIFKLYCGTAFDAVVAFGINFDFLSKWPRLYCECCQFILGKLNLSQKFDSMTRNVKHFDRIFLTLYALCIYGENLRFIFTGADMIHRNKWSLLYVSYDSE